MSTFVGNAPSMMGLSSSMAIDIDDDLPLMSQALPKSTGLETPASSLSRSESSIKSTPPLKSAANTYLTAEEILAHIATLDELHAQLQSLRLCTPRLLRSLVPENMVKSGGEIFENFNRTSTDILSDIETFSKGMRSAGPIFATAEKLRATFKDEVKRVVWVSESMIDRTIQVQELEPEPEPELKLEPVAESEILKAEQEQEVEIKTEKSSTDEIKSTDVPEITEIAENIELLADTGEPKNTDDQLDLDMKDDPDLAGDSDSLFNADPDMTIDFPEREDDGAESTSFLDQIEGLDDFHLPDDLAIPDSSTTNPGVVSVGDINLGDDTLTDDILILPEMDQLDQDTSITMDDDLELFGS
ncbi:uncharacterized protein V1516DRAFT_675033 [Lipomyces oligophaga]|uniref:uncharacterized protein n=1 Tax=Lipomyces oligophaga TaxID=45792 RepID=UPI0034CDF354